MKSREEAIYHFLTVFERLGVKMQELYNICVDDGDDITKQEFSLIGFVGKQEDVIMRDIANHLEVPYSTATGIVDKLVLKKYLKRYNSEADRRTVLVCLTAKKGQGMYDRYVASKYRIGQQVIEALDDSEQDQMINMLEKIAAHVSKKQVEETT